MISDRLPASTKGKSIKILLCGPPPMTNVMKKYLEELDYEKCKTVSKIDDQVFCWVIFSFSCHFLFFLRGDGFCFPIPSFSRVTRLTYIFLFFIWWWYRFLKKTGQGFLKRWSGEDDLSRDLYIKIQTRKDTNPRIVVV